MKKLLKKKLIGSLGFILLVSCGRTVGESNPKYVWVEVDSIAGDATPMKLSDKAAVVIDFTTAEWRDVVNTSDIADSVRLVRLDTPKGAEIGKIDKLLKTDSIIYILDRKKNPGIYVFSDSGKYINRIGQIGQGPGEVAEYTDFDVRGDSVYIIDQFKSQMTVYSPSGELIDTKRIPFITTGLSVLGKDAIVFNNVDADNQHLGKLIDYSNYITDGNLNIKMFGSYREHGKYTAMLVPQNFVRCDTVVLYHPALTGDIYSVSEIGEMEHKYRIDFGDKGLPYEYTLAENREKFRDDKVDMEYLMFYGQFHDTKGWLHYGYSDERIVKHGFYRKSDGRHYVTNGVYDDMTMELPAGDFVASEGNILISCLSPGLLHNSLEGRGEEELEKTLGKKKLQLIRSFGVEDNPILFFTYLKD